jgi:hypothetical protein
MNTIQRKKSVTAALGAAIAAAAAPAILFAGAGSAQAAVDVHPTSDALGVTVNIQSNGEYGWCRYTALHGIKPPGVVPPPPVLKVPFHLQQGGSHNLWFPSYQTGTTWNVTVECPNGPGPGDDTWNFSNEIY